MEKNVKLLIENIKNCNLSQEDKKVLLEKLERNDPDIDGFLDAYLIIIKVSDEILKIFDLDVWDLF